MAKTVYVVNKMDDMYPYFIVAGIFADKAKAEQCKQEYMDEDPDEYYDPNLLGDWDLSTHKKAIWVRELEVE